MTASKETVILVGTGPMAEEYVKVLKAIGNEIKVIGRGRASAENFEAKTGIKPITDGVDAWLGGLSSADASFKEHKIIVAVTENELGNVALSLLKAGFKSMLLEKPGGANYEQIEKVAAEAEKNGAKVYIAYNRRFNASTKKAMKIIKEDGGITSFHFEFTEWSHIVGTLKKADGVLENWFMQNSSHVVDLAFFLGGKPTEISSYTGGNLAWHPAASIFAGAGKTEKGALFSYQANWAAPGRWWVEMLTNKHRLILRPLEGLSIQNIGSVAIEEVPLDKTLDTEFKPGLYKEVESFLKDDSTDLCTIAEQAKSLSYYRKVCPYS